MQLMDQLTVVVLKTKHTDRMVGGSRLGRDINLLTTSQLPSTTSGGVHLKINLNNFSTNGRSINQLLRRGTRARLRMGFVTTATITNVRMGTLADTTMMPTALMTCRGVAAATANLTTKTSGGSKTSDGSETGRHRMGVGVGVGVGDVTHRLDVATAKIWHLTWSRALFSGLREVVELEARASSSIKHAFLPPFTHAHTHTCAHTRDVCMLEICQRDSIEIDSKCTSLFWNTPYRELSSPHLWTPFEI
jgi:hypothetical protein